jgi:hypothetical protein
MASGRASEGGQYQDFYKEDDQVRHSGMWGAIGERSRSPKESERDRVTHQPIDA